MGVLSLSSISEDGMDAADGHLGKQLLEKYFSLSARQADSSCSGEKSERLSEGSSSLSEVTLDPRSSEVDSGESTPADSSK